VEAVHSLSHSDKLTRTMGCRCDTQPTSLGAETRVTRVTFEACVTGEAFPKNP